MVHNKLQQARVALAKQPLKKSGLNKHLGFHYFELGDFLPAIQTIFAEMKLCGRTWLDHDTAYLAIYDGDKPESFVMFSSPTAEAKLAKAATPIQELGSMHTYMRRYLWIMAMEISENDVVDAETGNIATPKPLDKPLKGKPGGWQLSISPQVEGGIANWTAELKKLLDLALGFAKSTQDVNEIFRVNRNIFDTLKGEDEFAYAEVLEMFKNAKKKMEE
jgi:hypothetical protein